METVAALGLVSVAMTIMGQTMVEAINGSVTAGRRVQSILLAQEKMESVIANRSDLAAWEERAARDNPIDPDDPEAKLRRFSGAEFEDRGFSEADMNNYRWDWEIADRDDRPGMKQATVRAYWQSTSGARPWVKCELTTLLVAPGRE